MFTAEPAAVWCSPSLLSRNQPATSVWRGKFTVVFSAFTSAKVDEITRLQPDLVIGFSDIQAEIAQALIKRGVRFITLSNDARALAAQAKACGRHGLDVRLHDARRVSREDFGSFDAVASLGAFEHFCSREEQRAGRQEEIYRRFFERVAGVLGDGGRFYLQTMVFGPNMIPVEAIDRHAPRHSDAWYLAIMGAAFPGSFLPFGQEQVVRCAAPHFRLVSSVSGRLDYIETIRQWDLRTESWSPRMTLLKLRLLPRWLTSPNFRFAYTSGVSSNSVCFERELLDHYRLVFEKT